MGRAVFPFQAGELVQMEWYLPGIELVFVALCKLENVDAGRGLPAEETGLMDRRPREAQRVSVLNANAGLSDS